MCNFMNEYHKFNSQEEQKKLFGEHRTGPGWSQSAPETLVFHSFFSFFFSSFADQNF